MVTIGKYTLPFFGEIKLDIPYGAQFLSVNMHERKIVMYAIVDQDSTVECRKFRIYSTGGNIERSDLHSLRFIGTVQDEHWSEEWHVFERVDRR